MYIIKGDRQMPGSFNDDVKESGEIRMPQAGVILPEMLRLG